MSEPNPTVTDTELNDPALTPAALTPATTITYGAARDERGMSTAEYAVGTVAAVSFAGVLIKVLSDPTIQQLLIELIMWIIRTVSGMGN